MTKYFVIVLIIAAITYSFTFLKRQQRKERDLLLDPKSFYDLKINSIDGKEILFSQFKGKKVICVNVASYCGNTPQYEKLEKLAQKYKSRLVILGFPCNQFGKQEPGTPEEIKQFCKEHYDITFQLTEKVDVKGNDQHPVYEWLTKKALNSKMDTTVRWNFGKFLISESGELINYYSPKTSPTDSAIIEAIEKASN